ncbi:hypothetical protein N658DRAFT_555660 [Parathielavia hyrcaniae]|uniref:Uncharacterized protein n=1 Tax=Parathielavia hyrcaniae TaxID=113614 RepID=A0AAN6QB19_9PEZI|nr:hypothetical protein N658DRAFT_555660 [Parathielavia hyrcaniae]
MWEFSQSTCTVSEDASCSTHVHLSLAGGFSLVQLKRLAQAIIYFEPAVEALIPADRRANEYARSNWIENKHLAYKNLSRGQSVELIEACRTERDTVEFRRGAASSTARDVFKWVEFALAFLQASIQLPARGALASFPPNVGGLKKFFDSARLIEDPGMRRKSEGRAEPTPVKLESLSKQKTEKLHKKIEKDKHSNPMLDRITDASHKGLI